MSAAAFLSRVPLFAMLEDSELAQLLGTATTVDVAAGEYLFRRGDHGDALYIVETGLLDALIDEETASERTLNTVFPGDYFGEMALLTQEPRSASIRALIDSRLIRLSHEQFTRLLGSKPEMALHLSRVLSNYLSRANKNLSRRSSRMNTIVPTGNPQLTDALAEQLIASLERQFSTPAVLAMLGDEGPACPSVTELSSLSHILDSVVPMPAGGNCLRLGEAILQRMDDQAMVAVINSLRVKYGHIVVWARPAEALSRLSFLTRLDQTFLLACFPYDEGELSELSVELGKVMKGKLRMAAIAPRGQSLPKYDADGFPPIRLIAEPGARAPYQGVESLARALAGLTVGLALGSGTAQGLAHLGVMKALIEADIPIDMIAGTSGGALYGSMLASGLTIDESVKRVIHHTRRNLIDKLDFAVPTRGIIRGRRIETMVQSVIGDITFPELAIPLYAIAADLDTGEEVIIQEGLVYQGVRASISVPGIFEPYVLEGRILVDGVVVNPLPVSVARAMGANIVIAVQVPAPGKVNMEASARTNRQPSGRKRKNDYNIIGAIVRSHHYVGDRLADKSASEADIFIKPEVTGFGWREYSAAPAIIEAGYRAGQAAVQQILGLIRGS
jgi:NTE family protein